MILEGGESAEIRTVATGEKVSSVALRFPGDDELDAILGWLKNGRLLVRGSSTDHVYEVDLATGELRRHKK